MDMRISRRSILAAAVLPAVAPCCCGSSRNSCCDTPVLEPECISYASDRVYVDLEKCRTLARVGSSANIIDAERKLDLIVIHPSRRRFCVLSGLCTHFPRPLTYLPSRRVLQCNNFNHSIFDLEGRIVKGPAPRPIRRYTVRLSGGRLEIEL